MCGIFGYTGDRPASPIVLDGLAKLEYRGYDSAGVALVTAGGPLTVSKSVGNLAALRDSLDPLRLNGNVGIGHTRWATHGAPSRVNAHPLVDPDGRVAVVHNGIIENHLELRSELEAEGFAFTSQTDTECVLLLIARQLDRGLCVEEAVAAAARRLQGANVVAVASREEPTKLVAFRLGRAGGVVVGYGEGATLLSSDLAPLLPHTRRIAYLDSGEMVSLTPHAAEYRALDGEPAPRQPILAPYDAVAIAKGSYKHFMLKEIHDQPEALLDTTRGRISFGSESLNAAAIPLDDARLADVDRVILIGMGTSLHAAMVGRLWMETIAGIPADVDNSSEFRYRQPVLNERTLVVSVTQSGETADTLAGMDLAARSGANLVTLTNYPGSQATRLADSVMLLRAGPEIGVASTKTFVCSLACLLMLALRIGIARGAPGAARMRPIARGLAQLPRLLGDLVAEHSRYEALAREFGDASSFLFLGRGASYPLALEGALKLKEISYIHAEGYPAGEMKHGPMSLIDGDLPIVALAPRGDLYDKMLNNISEARARAGRIIAVATEGDERLADIADHVIPIPDAAPEILPMLLAAPMQLLAYHIGVLRGCDVDQPRNLAKTVTVE